MELKEIEKSIIERTITKITSLATTIRDYCFYDCDALTTANFPNATSIKREAFSGCSSLTNISFPNVTSIGDRAFYDCDALTTANFPNATSIGNNAFSYSEGCEVHLHPGILTIGVQGLTSAKPPKAIYLHYTNNDEVLFSPAAMIGAGENKNELTYNVYTDNTIIKDGVLSKADQYTIVNVKHLDGRDW